MPPRLHPYVSITTPKGALLRSAFASTFVQNAGESTRPSHVLYHLMALSHPELLSMMADDMTSLYSYIHVF